MAATLRLIWNLLSPRQRRSKLPLFALMVGSMLFEMLGIALIIPVFAALNSDLARSWNFPPQFTELEPMQRVLVAILVLLGTYTIKSLYLTLSHWRQVSYIFQLQADLSDWILGQFLHQPIEFHFQNHSMELSKQALHDTSQFARGAVMSCLAIASESFVTIGICSFLLFIKPVTTLCILAIFGAGAGIFHRVWRNRLYLWGQQRQIKESQAHRYMHEALTAIREIKVSGSELNFVKRYSIPSHSFAKIASNQSALQALPSIGLELLTVIGISILSAGLLLIKTPLSSIVPVIAVFALASSRLLPSISRILNHLNYLRFSTPIVESLSKAINNLEKTKKIELENVSNKNVLISWSCIELRNVSYTYPDREKPVLQNLNLNIEHGERLGIIGPTGAGKSTLIDILLGLLKPSSGTASVDSLDLADNSRIWHQLIGYVPQHPTLIDDSLLRNIAFGIPDDEIDNQALKEAIEVAQLVPVIEQLEQGLETIIGERGSRLSGGQCQRIAVARALYRKPQILILDEVSNGLDDLTEKALLNAISTLAHCPTIIMVSHRKSSLGICNRIHNIPVL